MSVIEDLFKFHVKAERLPEPSREYRFHDTRRWRFDFAWPDRMIACEIEGGTWVKGRHTTGTGFEKDCEKYNKANEIGWRVFRYTSDMVKRGEAIAQIKMVLMRGE